MLHESSDVMNRYFIPIIFGITVFAEQMNAQSALDLGKKALTEGQPKVAVKWFNWAIDADSTKSLNYVWRARAFRELGNTDEATSDIRDALRCDSTNGDAYFILSLLSFDKGEMNEAVINNTKAIRHNTYYRDDAYRNRGQLRARMGQIDLAILDFDTLVALESFNMPNDLFERGNFKMQVNDTKGAISDFKQVYSFNPNNVQLAWDIGRLSYSIEDFNTAVEYYTKAIERITDKDPQLYLIRGEAYEQLKGYENAIADYSLAIGLNPNIADAYYSRGQAKARAGRMKDACPDWIKAAELGNSEAANVIVYNCK